MVSVLPHITDAILPAKESAPYSFKIPDNIPIEPLPETGRISTRGITPSGIPIFSDMGEINFSIISIAPDAFSIDAPTSIATSGGNISFKSIIPSPAPSIKSLYTALFLERAAIIMSIIKAGVIYCISFSFFVTDRRYATNVGHMQKTRLQVSALNAKTFGNAFFTDTCKRVPRSTDYLIFLHSK